MIWGLSLSTNTPTMTGPCVLMVVGRRAMSTAAAIALPEFVHIPAGPFITGSDRPEREYAYRLDAQGYGHRITRERRCYENERERQTVTIGAFDIMKNLVSNRDYLRFIESTGYQAPDVDRQTWESYGLIHPYERTCRGTGIAHTAERKVVGRTQILQPPHLIWHQTQARMTLPTGRPSYGSASWPSACSTGIIDTQATSRLTPGGR